MAKTVRATMVVEGLVVAAGIPVKAGDLVGFLGGLVLPALGASGFYTAARGVALTGGRAGETVAMAVRGEVSGLAGLPQRGGLVYVDENTDGVISGTKPVTAGSWAQAVGWTTDGETPGSGTRVALTLQDDGVVV